MLAAVKWCQRSPHSYSIPALLSSTVGSRPKTKSNAVDEKSKVIRHQISVLL